MLVSDFQFDLPNDLIAQDPASKRDEARMLHISSSNIEDKMIKDLSDLVVPGDLFIFNDTKVIPARMTGNTTSGAKVEITLHKKESSNRWKAFAKPAKKLKVGDKLIISDDFYATVKSKDEGDILFEFSVADEDLWKNIDKYGSLPLPPYIDRKKGLKENDEDRYQTIYAKNPGAVAAPTAGLHFTNEMIDELKQKGANVAYVTLHVGAGTFLPVKVNDTKDHVMHSEYGIISESVADLINQTKKNGKRVIAVGTTSLRLLESAATDFGKIAPFNCETDIFITPGYKFKIIDALVTNFHLPGSTLFMLVSALAGLEKMKKAYNYAIEKKYRFYSYGDASFIEG
ncbi:tRNA preQ1(34) S-adenosylmethionine ribosyltransferase-isomerase QueA [Rickettsiales bacterium]|nr:tRNA preQ1(34) S-adenosylmethionine ribosyltransferase-isomerase QueA [Rickettsiales bacterium]